MIFLSPNQVTEEIGGTWQELPSPSFPIFY